jgi:hypothetical protein
MARNRKYRSAASRFGPALKAFVLCLLLGGSGVGYVWQKNQIFELGKLIKQREMRLAVIEEENSRLRNSLSEVTSPMSPKLAEKISKLGLVQPAPSQIWRLAEPSRQALKRDEPAQLAQR